MYVDETKIDKNLKKIQDISLDLDLSDNTHNEPINHIDDIGLQEIV